MAAATSVDDYLATLPEGPRAALQELRRTIGAAAPGATETIAYVMPAFKVVPVPRRLRSVQGSLQPLPGERRGPRGARGSAGALRHRQGDDPLPGG